MLVVASLLRAVVLAELDRHNAQMMLRLAREADDDIPMRGGATAGGDGARLRGLPAIGRGSSGAIRGTNPERALLDKERRAGR